MSSKQDWDLLQNTWEFESLIKVTESFIFDAPIKVVWNIIRDFNGHDRWHPAVAESHIERNRSSDQIGCVRSFKLADGSQLREQLLALSDQKFEFRYCLLDTPIPLFNYVAHVSLKPVTTDSTTFCEWVGQFDTPEGKREELVKIVRNDIYKAGFDAISKELSSSKEFADQFRSGELATEGFKDWSAEILQEFKDNEMNGAIGQNLVFENESVRVWHMVLAPGERMPVHRHNQTYFWTALQGGRFLQRTYDGTTYESEFPDGETHFYDVGRGEFALHNLENVGDSTMVFVAVELKKESQNEPLPVKPGVQFDGKTFKC